MRASARLLAAEEDVEVAAFARTDGDLRSACQDHRPSAVLIEAQVSDWDPLRLVAAVRRLLPEAVVIGLTTSPGTIWEASRARRAGLNALVSRDTGITGILVAMRAPANPLGRERGASPHRSSAAPIMSSSLLTSRELEVLSLVGAGLTSNGVSNRLGISHKTVENHKQRIFAKLGVQNQAHAVSVAIRTGLMRPERVVELAAGD